MQKAVLNAVELFKQHAQEHPEKMAIQLPFSEGVSFGELLKRGSYAQAVYRRAGLAPGDSVLLIDHLSPRLYASVIGILATGATAVLVEPWMPVERINKVLRLAKPKIFSAATLGWLWGARLKAAREIPKWLHASSIDGETNSPLEIIRVAPETPGILTFTSGTTGEPKGVVRGQGYMIEQHRILSSALHLEDHAGPDLCIFANFALANLASGRGTILVPPKWRNKDLRWLESLPKDLRPESLTCGPAFLLKLMQTCRLPSLESIHVGGALTDCWIFENAFQHFPESEVVHIYGSSEAEPVSLIDARESVRRSRDRGYFQALSLGQPVSAISAKIEADNLWVAGPHVCPLYIGGEEENRLHKRKDAEGRVWHSMGDRVRTDESGWWYAGRSGQSPRSFDLEQKVYSLLGSSKAFVIETDGRFEICVDIDRAKRKEVEKLLALEASSRLFEVEIQRDRRHRARIDRAASAKTRKPWQAG